MTRLWLLLNQELSLYRQQQQVLLVYSTGRSYTSYQELRATTEMLEPDALVTAVGTEIYRNGIQTPDPTWSEPDCNRVGTEIELWPQRPILVTSSPNKNRNSGPLRSVFCYIPTAAIEVLPQLEQTLKNQGLDVKLVYSGSKDLDVLPRHGDKGEAMAFLRQQFEIPAAQTLACGDSGNDRALFSVGEERGVIVGNAQPELLEWHYRHPSDHRYLGPSPVCCWHLGRIKALSVVAMIGYLKGLVVGIHTGTANRAILTLEVNQVGYDLQVPSRLRQQLPASR